MNRKAFTLIILASTFLSITGCSLGNNKITANPGNDTTGQEITTEAEPEEDGPVLSVKINKSTPVETPFEDLNAGDELYNGFGSTIKIKSIDEDEIKLDIDGCLVIPNADGSISLRSDPIEKVTLKRGETIELASQTMDAGVKLRIDYK